MDESQQEEQVDFLPTWTENFQKVHDELIRVQTRLETAISLNRPLDSLLLMKYIATLYAELGTILTLQDIFIKSVGKVQMQHNIVHDEAGTLRTDFNVYVKTSEKTFEAINNFMHEYKDMLQELANERNIRSRVRAPPPPPSPQQGGTPHP